MRSEWGTRPRMSAGRDCFEILRIGLRHDLVPRTGPSRRDLSESRDGHRRLTALEGGSTTTTIKSTPRAVRAQVLNPGLHVGDEKSRAGG